MKFYAPLFFLLLQIHTHAHSGQTKDPQEIHFMNRKTNTVETENVMGNKTIRFAYLTKFGRWITQPMLKQQAASILMGHSKNTKRSAKKIPSFIDDYKINMSEFEDRKYDTFNDFFARKFKEGKRTFDANPLVVSAGAEARYLVMENIGMSTMFPVKGTHIFLPELFGNTELAQEFEGGTIFIARLCPVDYHRFHFPMDATVQNTYTIHGNYDSVNPIALATKPDILFKNERQIAILKNSLIGQFAMIEVGAFAVGKIIQSAYPANANFPLSFQKGDEKGYFQFGASTVIWVFKKGQIKAAQDLIQNSLTGMETLVELGDHLGTVLQ